MLILCKSTKDFVLKGLGPLGRSLRTRWSGSVWDRAALVLEIAIALLAFQRILQLLNLFRFRLVHPFELEWMEGAVVDHTRRILSGEAIYGEPSLTFTPFIYTPLYYGVSAAVCQVTGIGLTGPRLVSVAATLGTLWLITSFVHRQSRDPLAALVACGWFTATYGLTAFWFDIARVDSLFLFLTLASIWIARFGNSFPAAIGAGGILFLAFFTKQTALPFLAPVVAFTFVRGWKHALLSLASFTTPTVLAIWWMNRSSDGWFSYYVFHVPGQHEVLWDRWRPLLVDFFVTPVMVPLIFVLFALLVGKVASENRRQRIAYAVFVLTACASSYSSLLHRDGYVNVLMPALAALAVVSGIGFALARSHVASRGSWSPRLLILFSIGWALAFTPIFYEPRDALPSRADRKAGQIMLEALESVPGPLWMPGTGHFAFETGHESTAHAMALADIFKTREPTIKKELLDEILASVHQNKWGAVVLDPSFALLPPEITKAVKSQYRLHKRVYPSNHDGWPKSGFRTRPEEIWTPR